MNILIAIIPLIVIVLVSAIVVRISAVMLKMTGMDEKTARFQALSAFTGTGFTTRDSERVVANEKRRKIITVLMILGNAGIVSVITTLVLYVFKSGEGSPSLKLLVIVFALLVIYLLISNRAITRRVNRIIENKIVDSKILEKKPIEEIVDLPKGYGIFELNVKEGLKEAGLSLGEAGFRNKDIMVLSIEKRDRTISSPKANDIIEKGDKILCYGHGKSVKEVLWD